jgi:hypothetical protein
VRITSPITHGPGWRGPGQAVNNVASLVRLYASAGRSRRVHALVMQRRDRDFFVRLAARIVLGRTCRLEFGTEESNFKPGITACSCGFGTKNQQRD